MQNLSKRIEKLEDQLAIGGTETALQSIVRRQKCLTWFYGHANATQAEMVDYAKKNSINDYQYKNNLNVFLQLIDERKSGRKFEVRQGGLV